MAKRLRQSNLFDTFLKKHKESDSEEMSQQDIMEESDTQTVTTIIVILRQKAPRIQDTITILNLRVIMTFKQMIVFLLVVQY